MATMKPDLMLALWREAGRHLDASESIGVIAELLVQELPLQSLRLDERSASVADLVTLANWDSGSGLSRRHHALGCSDKALHAIERWALRRELAECSMGGRWPASLIALGDNPDAVAALAGPLVLDNRLYGIAIIRAERAFTAAEKTLFLAVLEPLAAVVGNDFRLREISRLSARTEAERDSLLSRLGRKGMKEDIVGADSGLRKVMTRVEQVAATDTTVLILGETGSGKEVIARAIHEQSARREGPFIRVNCGAVAPELIDSELFGHERGSFTGAMATRRGWFERASGGTLFLDEIGELTPPVQVRLLRVLQDGVVQRVGSEQELAVDVRIVAATHRDLPTFVQEGRFREDLWYRIAVFPIILPPLRERPDDIPDLALHFMQRAANRLGLRVAPLTTDAIARLRGYPWPGNVRELAAVIERAIILGQGVQLDLDHALGTTLQIAEEAAPTLRPAATAQLRDVKSVDSLEQTIIAHIKNALEVCAGRVDGPYGAARLLSINPSTLRSKMRKLGISAQ